MDEDTLRGLLAGDEDAFRGAYRDIQPRLLRYLTGMVGPDDALDVASEAWAQAVRDLGKFHGSADGFRGWITTIARNRALDLLRSQARRPLVDTDPVDHAGTTPSAEALALDGIGSDRAMKLIRSLPPEQAEAVLLRSVMALDAKTAAQVLGRRPGAVRTAAYRGLNTLREMLETGPGGASSDILEPPDAEGTR